jgi:hypothetical protein
VEVFTSPNLVVEKIEVKEAIYDLSIDLHGPTCELLKVHNSTNATQVFFMSYHFVILKDVNLRVTSKSQKPTRARAMAQQKSQVHDTKTHQNLKHTIDP